ncbi:MAG: hypothetical protein ACYCTZ_06495 [Candidatus Dormibacteria bacterium]
MPTWRRRPQVLGLEFHLDSTPQRESISAGIDIATALSRRSQRAISLGGAGVLGRVVRTLSRPGQGRAPGGDGMGLT